MDRTFWSTKLWGQIFNETVFDAPTSNLSPQESLINYLLVPFSTCVYTTVLLLMLQESNEPPKGCIKVEWNGSFTTSGSSGGITSWGFLKSHHICKYLHSPNWAYILVWKGRVSHHEFHYKKIKVRSEYIPDIFGAFIVGNPHVPLWVGGRSKETNYHSVHKHANDNSTINTLACRSMRELSPCCTFSTFLSPATNKINNMF